MQEVFKKTTAILFVGFLVAALFSSGGVLPTRANIAEASFLDIIIGLVAINPLHVSISVPAEVELRRNFKAEVTVENKGDERIRNLKVEIFTSSGLVLVNKNTVKEFGVLNGNSTKNISWQVKGTEVGYFSISVSASGEVRSDAISAQGNTALVDVVGRFPPPRPRLSVFARFLSFFSGWF